MNYFFLLDWTRPLARACGIVVALAPGAALTACGSTQAVPDAPLSDGAAPTLDVDPGTDAATADAATVDAAPQDAPATGDASPDAAPRPPTVLFLGNSYTYAYDLPAMVRAVGAATPGGAVEVDSITVGSSTLQSLWSGTDAQAWIASRRFNAVVLQGQSIEPISSPANFLEYASRFGNAVTAAGGRPIWYATWARRAGDPIYGAEFSGGSPAAMAQRLEDAYQAAARASGGFVARVGAAWQLAVTEQPGVELYAGDGSHPLAAGVLLTACVMVQAITGRVPRAPEMPPWEIPRETAAALCALAPRVACAGSGALCGGSCVDVSQDPAHCGACDAACPAPRQCTAGVCR